MRMLLVMLAMTIAHAAATQPTNRQQADSLTQILKQISKGPGRLEPLLRLADYHAFKPGENKIDFDSANACVEEAARINKSNPVAGADGRILLTQAFIYREKGDEANGRKAVEQAIPLLEKSAYRYCLGKAYFELSGYYSRQALTTSIQKLEVSP
ncbi:hypothetical protein [Paraflavitalea pollutisoli]|uniref:hypothetical protein n=1 Tax=Paraflavitalea pollutisoli TaxID=3034143 RepID=UPI0023EC5265|nr:hypothetical protein [Paraflavitalea sp. H1-2-19X]